MKRKVGGMQPYLFPYLGYFQLISAVDVFVLSDNLQYIERGWINRNRILINGKEKLITFPLKKGSHSLNINERVMNDNFPDEMEKLLKVLRTAYARAPQYGTVMPLLEEIIRYPEMNLAKYAENAIRKICGHLDIGTPLVLGSGMEIHDATDKTDRVLKMIKALGGEMFINPIGGAKLYDVDYFRRHGVELKFHKIDDITYRQFDNDFVPCLSIIDVLMFNDLRQVQAMLHRYSLLQTPAELAPYREQQDGSARADDMLLASLA